MPAVSGEWYAARNEHNSQPDVPDVIRYVYATQANGERYIVAKVWSGDDGDYESTARLVAATPKLLAACRSLVASLVDWCEIAEPDDVRADDLRAIAAGQFAIAKAEGRL